jgi:hypothetical protein
MTIRKNSGLGKQMHLLAVMIAAGLLTSGSSFATDDGKPDRGIEALLRKVEHRVSSKHMMSPEGGSAMDAWQEVLEVVPTTAPERVSNALRNFAVHWRRRANEEQHDGNFAVAAGLSVFASQAEAMGSGKPDAARAVEVTTTDVAPAPSQSPEPPVGLSEVEKTVPAPSELQTPAIEQPPQPHPASITAAPVESARVHHVSDAHPHVAEPRRRQVEVSEARNPPVDRNGVIQGLLY